MFPKYLFLFLLLSPILCGLRFYDEDMLKQHHKHTYKSDTPLTVYLIPHSHDDVGWLKTVDNYFYGGDQNTQWAGVQYTIDSVVTELSMNPTYKFSIVEMAFLYRWWNNANSTQRDLIKQHIKSGQLEIINGGWCMSDEATTYYEDIIDQMTTGLTWAKNTFGVVPTIGWHLDPFGHQSSNAALFSQFGFNAWFFSRMDYQDKSVRLEKKALEMVWHPTQYSGNDNYIFTHMTYYHYSPPPGFCFDSLCRDTPIKDDPTLEDYNFDERSTNLTNYFKSMASHYRSANLFHTLGDDFHFSNARMWYLNFDKLIKKINSNSSYGVTLKYGTPSDYISAINKQSNVYPTKTDDFYPYADHSHAYWTGYFTSRVSLKSLAKELGRYVQTVKNHISFLRLSNSSSYINSKTQEVEAAIWELDMIQGIWQHHDAVAGTEKQKVANDYVMLTSRAYTAFHKVYDEIRKEIINKEIGETQSSFSRTLWNTTYEDWGISKTLNEGKTVLLHLYNPGPADTYMTRIKLDNSIPALSIINSDNENVQGDLICSNSANTKDCELILNLKYKEASYSYLKLKKLSSGGSMKVVSLESVSPTAVTKNFTFTQTSNMKFTRAQNKMDITTSGKTFSITPSYNYYESFQADNQQRSGAYIFRPSNATLNNSKKYTTFKNFHYAEGDTTTVFVYEGDKTYTKVYFSKIAQEIETKGFEMETFMDSIDVSDGQGKEVVLNLAHSISNNKTFYTDSNGLEEQKRIVDFRPTWTYSVNEPVSGNYYPINSHISLNDSSGKLSVLVDRSEGGTACKDGFIQLMIHRRTLKDDSRGVGEPLNETEDNGAGLRQKIRHWVTNADNVRARQKANDQAVVITWGESPSEKFSKSEPLSPVFPAPNDVKIYLRPYTDGTYLFRAHNFNTKQQRTLNINDKWSLMETTLGANQLLSDWKGKQMKWKDEPYTVADEQVMVRIRERETGRSEDVAGSLTLKPFEIRTFILTVA